MRIKSKCPLFINLIILILLMMPHMAQASEPEATIKVIINSKELDMDVAPVVVNDRVLVPFRVLFEAMGLQVEWDSRLKTVVAKSETKNGTLVKYISITVGKTYAYLNDGKEITLDTPPIIINDRTMVPLRFIAESLGMEVDWDDANKTVIISNKEIILDSHGFIVKRTGEIDIKSEIEFLAFKDFAPESKYFLALGENKMLYIIDKLNLSHRLISKNKSSEIKDVHYYNQKFYYLDINDFYRTAIKVTDGIRETELSELDDLKFIIKNKLYVINKYYASPKSAEIKYIDMNTDRIFSITNAEYLYLLYISEDVVFYINLKHKDVSDIQADFHICTLGKGNSYDDKILLSLTNESNREPSYYQYKEIGEDKYVRPDLIQVGNYFILYNDGNGIYEFNPSTKTIAKISDIVARHAYYANNRLYVINENEVGYIDLDSNTYFKVFSKVSIFKTANKISIEEVDNEGNITFTTRRDMGMQHFDVYTYKYLVSENKLKLTSFTPARIGEFNKEEIQKLKENLIEVDD